jgi:hypothetical protein
MLKKKNVLCLGLIALVASIGVPSAASAAPVLYSGGTAIPVGTEIAGTQVNGTRILFYSPLGTWECSNATLKGTVTRNSEKAEATVNQFTFGGIEEGGLCPSPYGRVEVSMRSPTCLATSGTTGAWILRGSSCDRAFLPNRLSFTYPGLGHTCTYNLGAATPVPLTGNINSEPLQLMVWHGSAVFTIYEGQSPFLCPSKYEPAFDLELKTSAGAPLKAVF